MELFSQTGGEMLSRWGHYLAGVTWIGLLYYFNFVQVPSLAALDAGPRTEVVRKLAPRALWWFRWGAVLTLLTGLSILYFQGHLMGGEYFQTSPGRSISVGVLLALVMFANVWGVIWPKQKVVIASAEQVGAGGEALAAAPAAGRKALCASRTNTLFSIPMLFFMAATSHFAFLFEDGAGGQRAIFWGITVLVIVVIEALALSAPAAGSPLSWHIDNHRNTIVAGFVLTAFLLLLFEVLF